MHWTSIRKEMRWKLSSDSVPLTLKCHMSMCVLSLDHWDKTSLTRNRRQKTSTATFLTHKVYTRILFYLTTVASHFPSARLTSRVLTCHVRICYVWRISANIGNAFPKPSSSLVSKSWTLTAIHSTQNASWLTRTVARKLQRLSSREEIWMKRDASWKIK